LLLLLLLPLLSLLGVPIHAPNQPGAAEPAPASAAVAFADGEPVDQAAAFDAAAVYAAGIQAAISGSALAAGGGMLDAAMGDPAAYHPGESSVWEKETVTVVAVYVQEKSGTVFHSMSDIAGVLPAQSPVYCLCLLLPLFLLGAPTSPRQEHEMPEEPSCAAPAADLAAGDDTAAATAAAVGDSRGAVSSSLASAVQEPTAHQPGEGLFRNQLQPFLQ
jgi:hypothetical protein